MKKVITYGTFDLFHEGHLRLLQRAKALGDYLIVGVTTDHFDQERGKINTHDSVIERIESVKRSNLADQIIIEEYQGQKIDDIQRFGVDIFAIGSDWEGNFDYLKHYCEVVYLPRTEGISSTQLRNNAQTVQLGIIGTGSIASRFVHEASFVSNIKITSVYNPDHRYALLFSQQNSIPFAANSFQELCEHCNAIYIASPYDTHYDYTKAALVAGHHVLCETPFVLKKEEAEELFSLASSKGLQLSVALKTAYCPAFRHLISLLQSRVIGDIVEVEATTTTLIEEAKSSVEIYRLGGSMIENACFPLLPVIKLFGVDYMNVSFYSRFEGENDIFTKGIIQYPNAIASFNVGLGVKSEGDLTISGTKGYAYVPAPWWKTDYFELRFEDQNRNKRYFYPYEGAGLRYELKDFINGIVIPNKFPNVSLSPNENIAIIKILDLFLQKNKCFLI